MVRAICRILIGLALLAGPASASDLKTYVYDAQGRLTATARVASGPGSYVGYVFDDADNRLQRATGIVPLPAQPFQLSSGEVIVPIQSLVSGDGRSTLRLQADGNLVLYFGSTPLWASGTGVGNTMLLGMQGDGNLVLYSPSFAPLWASGTAGYPGAVAVLQNDCNLVIYSGSTPLWATGTQC